MQNHPHFLIKLPYHHLTLHISFSHSKSFLENRNCHHCLIVAFLWVFQQHRGWYVWNVSSNNYQNLLEHPKTSETQEMERKRTSWGIGCALSKSMIAAEGSQTTFKTIAQCWYIFCPHLRLYVPKYHFISFMIVRLSRRDKKVVSEGVRIILHGVTKELVCCVVQTTYSYICICICMYIVYMRLFWGA